MSRIFFFFFMYGKREKNVILVSLRLKDNSHLTFREFLLGLRLDSRLFIDRLRSTDMCRDFFSNDF